ncbi:hypothetical protein F5878DRAFT_618079 [Lentinula raphanica]|uniref:Uncharacterized protein n=1 Tax=Lentinula raphanica TaxID=153919 RepID=A0AA38PA67_9AGAR|nr:hypothetical protein F5878DRAFT_618079 [Lentinula raphanica]
MFQILMHCLLEAGRADLGSSSVRNGPHTLSTPTRTALAQGGSGQATFQVAFPSTQPYSRMDLEKRPPSSDTPREVKAIIQTYLRTLSPTHSVEFKTEYHGPGIEGTDIKFDLLDSESGHQCSGEAGCKGVLRLLGGRYFAKLLTDSESKPQGPEYPTPDSLVDLGMVKPGKPRSRWLPSSKFSSKTLFVEYEPLNINPFFGKGPPTPVPPDSPVPWYTLKDAQEEVLNKLIEQQLEKKFKTKFKSVSAVHFLDRLITTALRIDDITAVFLRVIDSSKGYKAYRVTVAIDRSLSQVNGKRQNLGAGVGEDMYTDPIGHFQA